MRGYYEWTGEAGAKDAHFLHGKHRLAAAGIYTPRKDENDEWYLTMSIITREARDASGEVHDRMPVFLEPERLRPLALAGEARGAGRARRAGHAAREGLRRGRRHDHDLRGRPPGEQLAHRRSGRRDADRAAGGLGTIN